MKSAFIQWSVLIERGAALFEDLRSHTAIDTIELSNFTLDWDATQDDSGATAPAQLALPVTDRFGSLPVAVAAPGDYEVLAQVTERISAAGFRVACNITPFYLSAREASHLGCIDVTGRMVPGLRPSLGVYGCPSRPEVAAYGEAMARAFVASWPTIDVLMINHVEYLFWPQMRAEEVLSCFCAECRKRARALDIDLDRVARELRRAIEELRQSQWPGALRTLAVDYELIARWLGFRRDAVSDCVRRIVDGARAEAAARGIELSVGLEAQLPALAPVVGTDVGQLADICDFLVAKFPDYLAATILPWLASSISGERTGPMLGDLRHLLGLGGGPSRYVPAEDFGEGLIYSNAFDEAAFDFQLPLLEGLRGRVPMHAYLWKYGNDDEVLGRKIRAVEQRGFEGYFLWVWNRDLDASALRRWPVGPAESLGAA